jgi:hypothetical protein
LSASSGAIPGRESTIILIPLQIACFLLAATVMVSSFVHLYRRERRSWEAIMARMSPACRRAWVISNGSEALNLAWTRTPRIAFRDAGVLMEMAEYMERNSTSCDGTRLELVRSAALDLRFAAAGAIFSRILFR